MNNDEQKKGNYFSDGGFILGEVREEEPKKKKKRKKNKEEKKEEPKVETPVVEETPEEVTIIDTKEDVYEQKVEEPKEEINEETSEDNKSKGGLAFAIFGIVIILIGVVGVLGLLTNKEFKELVLHQTTTTESTTTKKTTTTTTTTTQYVDPSTITEKINYGSTIGVTIYFTKVDDVYATSITSSANKYSEYVCKTTNCMVFDVSGTGKYATIYDNDKYFLFDVLNKKEIKNLSLPMRNYAEIHTYDGGNVIGLLLKLRKGTGIGYYDVTNNKLAINFDEYNFITTSDFIFSKGYLLCYSYNNRRYVLYDAIKKQVAKEKISHVITSKTSQDYYFDNVDLYGSGTSASKIYDKDFNEIYDGLGVPVNKILFDNNELFMYDSRNIYLFKNYKLIRKSVNYNKVIEANREYAVVNKNSKLSIVDSEDNVLVTMMDYKQTLSVTDINISDTNITFTIHDNDYVCKDMTIDKSKAVAAIGNTEESMTDGAIKTKCGNKKLDVYIKGNFNRATSELQYTVIVQ